MSDTCYFPEIRLERYSMARKRFFELNKTHKYRWDRYHIGLCVVMGTVSMRSFEWKQVCQYYPEFKDVSIIPDAWGVYKWPTDEFGFLCRMRAIRKVKNELKKRLL